MQNMVNHCRLSFMIYQWQNWCEIPTRQSHAVSPYAQVFQKTMCVLIGACGPIMTNTVNF